MGPYSIAPSAEQTMNSKLSEKQDKAQAHSRLDGSTTEQRMNNAELQHTPPMKTSANEGKDNHIRMSNDQLNSSVLPIEEEYSTTPLKKSEDDLIKVPPILKKSIVHQMQNVLLVFKSLEIQIYEETWSYEKRRPILKQLSPQYIPWNRLIDYMGLDKPTLEAKLLRCLHRRQGENVSVKDQLIFIDEKDIDRVNADGFSYKTKGGAERTLSNDKRRKSYGKRKRISRLGSQLARSISSKGSLQSMDTVFFNQPEYTSKVHKIKSSLLTEEGQSFRLIITMPSIAYRLEAEQFHFVKTLTMREIYGYIKRNFNEWHSEMLTHLMGNEYFEK